MEDVKKRSDVEEDWGVGLIVNMQHSIFNLKRRIPKYFLTLLLLFNVLFAQSSWAKYGWQIYENAGDASSIAMGNTTIQ